MRSAMSALTGAAFGIGYAVAGWAQAAAPGPLIQPESTVKVSEHVYVIKDESRRYIPNVGIVVGERATLVIDPGLGVRNGEIVLAEARKVSKGKTLYVAATHHHPEHDLGAAAFPPDAKMIRSRDQQRDVEEFGLTLAQNFASRGPELASLIAGARDRPADVSFDDEYRLDLGGVTVRMQAAGPAHTLGDTIFYVEQDRVLFGGDIAQRRAPILRSPTSGVRVWLEALAKLTAYDFEILVPSHGPLGDVATIEANEQYFTTVQARTRELKRQGMSAEQITAQLTKELAPRFSEWPNFGADIVAESVKHAFAEAQ